MSYTATQLKAKFLLKHDLYSAYFTDSQISDILTEACRRVVEKEYAQYELTNKISENLSGLLARVNGAPTTSASHDKPTNWKYILKLEQKYVDGVITYYKAAKQKRQGDADDPYEAATMRYPQYEIRDKIYFNPAGVSEINLVYLTEPTAVNITSSPNATLPLPMKLQDSMIDEAVKIAAAISREDGMYAVQNKEVQDNP